jgi:L-gulonolactone oxidase
VRFVEMEYAIPREAAAEAVRRVRRFVEESGQLVSFPVEVRFVAADDIPLSPAYGRESAFVAVHVYRGMPYEEYFRGVERIMRDFEGRPHWGKIHFQSAETLARLYPEWDRFQEVRARLDPAGRFSNSHLDRVLGPVGG